MEGIWSPENLWEPDQAEVCNEDCNPSTEKMKHRAMLRFASRAFCLLGESTLKNFLLRPGFVD